MDRNSVIGLLLIAAILIGYSIVFSPDRERIEKDPEGERTEQKDPTEEEDRGSRRRSERERESEEGEAKSEEDEEERREEAPAAEEKEAEEKTEPERADRQDSTELRDRYGVFAPAAEKRESEKHTIENERLEVELSEKGGRISSVRLKEYETYDSLPLRLFDEDSSHYGVRLNTGRGFIESDELHFEALDSGFSVSGDQRDEIRFRTPTTEDGVHLEFVYWLEGESYDVEHEVRVKGLAPHVTSRDLELDWGYKNLSTEKNVEGQQRISTICYQYIGGESSYLTQQGEDRVEPTASLDWVAFKQRFFSSIITSDEGFDKNRAVLETEELNSSKYISRFQAKLNLPLRNLDDDRYSMSFFFGPNKYHLLASYEKGYAGILNLGWGIIGWINEYLIIPIFGVLDNTTLSYGIIILILTLIIKTLLFPLTYKSFLSGAKQRVLKPEVEKLQEKYKGGEDQMKMQQEMMALYRKSGVNPMAGCLPMFIQLPILIAMYRFFPTSIELRQESFLWAEDLSTYDSVLDLPFNIPFYGDHVSLFTLLMFASTMLYTKMSSSQMGGGGQQMAQMKVMMYIFPIFILFIFNSWPSGLSYYYFTANVISIFQMLVVKHWIIDEEALKRKIEENRKKPQKQKKQSKFQKRLEEMSKQKGQKPKK